MYGGDLTALEEAIKLGMVSDKLKSFRQKQVVIFDLETLEKDIALNTNIEVEGVLKLVSIGCASTLSTESRYFERKSSLPEHSTELVGEFLDHMFELEKLYIQTVPAEIKDAVPDDDDDDFEENVGEIKRIQRELKKYLTMPILGYNSSKFSKPFNITLMI